MSMAKTSTDHFDECVGYQATYIHTVEAQLMLVLFSLLHGTHHASMKTTLLKEFYLHMSLVYYKQWSKIQKQKCTLTMDSLLLYSLIE